MFGPHLTLELYGCPNNLLEDMNLMVDFLDSMPNQIGMTKIMPPYVFKYSGLVPEDWGLSGIVIIAESHIACHSFPSKGLLTFDIFSCKEFDVDLTIGIVEKYFKPTKMDSHLIMRGREFPRSPARSTEILERDRLAVVSGKPGF